MFLAIPTTPWSFKIVHAQVGHADTEDTGEVYRTRLQAEQRCGVLNTPPEDHARLIAAADARRLKLAPWIPLNLYGQAIEGFDGGDVVRLLGSASNMYAPAIVAANVEPLKARDLYEQALIYALTMPRLNLAHVPWNDVLGLIRLADRTRLRATGDPFPGSGPFTVYRGVAGRGRARRVRGLSWTLSLPRAAWFANRLTPHLPAPAVYRLTVPVSRVLAYLNGGHRNEEEMLVLCEPGDRPQRCLDDAELVGLAAK